MRVLVACEFSGVVRRAFSERGYDAWSCDLLPANDKSDHHIQGNVLDILDDGWDMMIAHPPCTYLANSGVRWLHERNGRWQKMNRAIEFFNNLLDAEIPMIAVENPIQHKYARQHIRRYDQIIQPWMFGHGETKATCLWLKNLPPLMATVIHTEREGRIWKIPPSEQRGMLRSITYQGIADAMAQQWRQHEAARQS